MSSVYCMVCLHTNKKYIGSTKQKVKDRVRSHFARHKDTEFYRDIDFYGKDGWVYGVIEEVDEDQRKIREKTTG